MTKFQTWRTPVNIYWIRSHIQPTRGGTPAWRSGEGLTVHHRNWHVMKCCTGPQTWLRVYKNRVARKTFGPKKEEAMRLQKSAQWEVSWFVLFIRYLNDHSKQDDMGSLRRWRHYDPSKCWFILNDSVLPYVQNTGNFIQCVSTRNLCTERIQQCSTSLTCGWSQNTLLLTNTVTSSLSFCAASRWPCTSNFVTIPSTARRTAWLSTDRNWWCHRLESANLSHKSKFSSPS